MDARVEEYNSDKEWSGQHQNNASTTYPSEDLKRPMQEESLTDELQTQLGVPTQEEPLKYGTHTGVCQGANVSIAVIAAVIIAAASFILSVGTGVAVFVALGMQANPCVNNTVCPVGSGDGTSSNNSLRIELDRILSEQKVLKTQQENLHLLLVQLAEADMRENVSYLDTAVQSNTQLLANLTKHVFSVTGDHSDQLSSVSSALSNFSNQLALIDSSVDRLNSNQSAQQRDIESLQTNLNTLNSQVIENSNGLSQQGQQLSSIDGRLNSQQRDIAVLQSTSSALNSQVTENSNGLSEQGERLSNLDGRVSSQQRDIAALQTTLSALNSQVSENRNGLSAQGQRLSSIDGQVDSLQRDTSMVMSHVTRLENRITSLHQNSGDATCPFTLLTILCWSFIIVSYAT